jgi:hypothetical protein
LDADSWNGLSNSERRRLVARLGLTASAAGYQSADCTTTSGVNVAKWLRTTGVRLQDDPNATEMIAQAPPETLEERLSGRIPGRRLWTDQPTEASPAECSRVGSAQVFLPRKTVIGWNPASTRSVPGCRPSTAS